MRSRTTLSALFLSLSYPLLAQSDPDADLKRLQTQYTALQQQQEQLVLPIEKAKLAVMRHHLEQQGLPALDPGEQVIWHPGHCLVWDEVHNIPKWTAHIVMSDILKGNLARVDTFLPDPDIKDNTQLFDEYWFSGYDRGHMVPSADMRWSQEALTPTYYYSNIAPQRPELNRGTWAELEDWGRRYVHYANERVFVVTGPIMSADMPLLTTPKAKEKVSIPSAFFKVFADLDGPERKGIAFIMTNGLNDGAPIGYAVTIDSVEERTGLDLFAGMADAEEAAIESGFDLEQWYHEGDPFMGEVPPLKAPLPGGRFNTTQAKYQVGKAVTICGTVVGTRRTQKANALYLNFDRLHPHQDFYATIWDYNGPNFHYDPETFLVDKQVCVTGKVTLFDDIPRISVNNESEITFWNDVQSGKVK
jgi:endonuclease G, mitochondrial